MDQESTVQRGGFHSVVDEEKSTCVRIEQPRCYREVGSLSESSGYKDVPTVVRARQLRDPDVCHL